MLLTMRPTGGHSPVYADRQDWTIQDDERNVMFRHACKLDLEGIVSKRLGSRYLGGRSRDWLKVKNPAAPAGKREAEEDWGQWEVALEAECVSWVAYRVSRRSARSSSRVGWHRLCWATT